MKHLKIIFMCTLLLLIPTMVYAQSKITGKVVDIKNDPLIGVSVLIKGTSNGTVTDVDGNFSLNADSGILTISYIGYRSQEIPITGKTKFNIVLEEDSKMLEDIVVVGYGTQSKRNLTGAVSDIKSDELTRTASTTTAGALAGRIQGISVRAKDARPGRGAVLEVRNMGNPLFVIDGIPYGGQTGGDWVQSSNVSGTDIFNSLNLEDIESISILKDASAAIYGLRAASGVVLVTTKKGKNDEKVRININGQYGWQNLTRFPKMASAAQYTRGWVEAEQNAGVDPSKYTYSPEELAKWQAGTEPGYKGYDYYDLTMRKNIPQYQINANVTGGSKNSNYFLSVSNTGQDALMEDFSYERTNVQANLEAKLLKGLTIGTQISGKQENSKDVGLPGGDGYFAAILGMFSNRPTVGPYANDNPNYINHTNDFSRNPALFHRDIAGYKDNLYRNANINLYAQYKFDFGLSAKGTVSYNYTNNKFDGFQYTYDVYTYNKGNDSYDRTGGSDAGWRYQTEREVVSRYGQFQLDYAKQINNHYFSATLAYERSDYDKNYLSMGTNPSNNYLPALEFDKMNSFGDDWSYEARAGYIGRLNYNYQGKYLVELLGRYDGSYLYAAGKRWGFFPGASLGWRISDEPFFKGLKGAVNDLKIRASIGQTGLEQGVGMFGYLGGYTWNQGNAVLDGNFVTGVSPRGLPITNLTWVKNTNSNLGIDIAMLNNKLTITADIFKIKRTGVPAARYDILLPSEIGYTLPNENLNENGYYGAEGIITYTDKIGNVNYTVSGNATMSRYKEIKSYKPRFGNSWDEYRSSTEDRWGGIWWGYQVVGRFQSEDEIKNYTVDIDGQNNRTLLPGDFIYKDVNGDGIINSMDERPIGYPTGWAPMVTFGGHIGLEWKGIDINLDFAGGTMQSWNQNYELRNPFHGGGNSPEYLLEDRWHRADLYDPNSEWIPGYYPAIRNGNTGPNARNSDFWLTNIRYLRFRNMELGYSLPKNLLTKIRAEKIRLFVNGANLISADNVGKYQIDPEIEASAAVTYPQQRTVLIGFNVTF
ncbi:TonB-linked SusC/RagA family outer membrane protein [Dysgonomonas alginatilytica]|uniref:TonB-linked SusC/RagA family outer membrane protein n=1 Tax=Dysgonomonas alginatilytica TaxID=1605892 RepID=A0A2V3PQN7_9BACT|nr:TonB-dependent receptor [Dysgonomonas alginatilytica]PXV66358.1 TonB-linked SusC/RagA family outer membrane protein [Dysgonomonas alginatilytica]